MATVFISHKRDDEQRARMIGELLKLKGVSYFLDVLDRDINSVSDITKYIVQKIEEHSNLLVVFTELTRGSLWVPFELGVGYRAEKGIAAYIEGAPQIPSYLNAFPKLRNVNDLNKYVDVINESQEIRKSVTDPSDRYRNDSSGQPGRYSEAFISRLKTRLGQ